MRTRPYTSRLLNRFERWLWTGPAGHLAGGALDFTGALALYLWARVRGRTIR